MPPISNIDSSYIDRFYKNNTVDTRNSKNADAMKYAMGLGMFTNQNYYAGYDRFGGEQNSYFTSKNGYTDVVERTREWIG